jgi:integrase
MLSGSGREEGVDMAEKLVKRGKCWYYRYIDADGVRRMRKGCSDRRVTEEMLRAAENAAAEARSNPKEAGYRVHEARPLADHLVDWEANLMAQGFTSKHAGQAANRARRLVAVILGVDVVSLDHRHLAPKDRGDAIRKVEQHIAPSRLSDLAAEKIQAAIARLQAAGWSHQTCNHYLAAVKAFLKWCFDTYRIRERPRGLKGYNVEEDRRHDRRTLSLEELRRLVEAAHRGKPYYGVSGPARALCYRTAAATGLRFSELASLTPESFDWDAPSVTVQAAYAKNGQTAKLALPDDVAADLAVFVATLAPGTPVFCLPLGLGARLVRYDLKAAGIPYEVGGQFFDFHSLRCETATLADQAGVTPRVVQELMRHSSLELTGRYTRPRAVDIEAAAALLPSLKPQGDQPEALAATGTDSSHVHTLAPSCIPEGDGNSRTLADTVASTGSGPHLSMGARPRKKQGLGASVRGRAGVGGVGEGSAKSCHSRLP